MTNTQRPAERRKTYSLSAERSHLLALQTVKLTKELGKTVARQDVLDTLVGFLKNKETYAQVAKELAA